MAYCIGLDACRFLKSNILLHVRVTHEDVWREILNNETNFKNYCYLKRNKSFLIIYIVVLSVSCLTHSSAMIFFWLMVTRYTDPSICHRLMCLTSTAVTDPWLMLVQSDGCPLENNFLNWQGKPLYSHNITK